MSELSGEKAPAIWNRFRFKPKLFLKRLLQGVFIYAALLHLYALALAVISAPGTILMTQRSLSEAQVWRNITPLDEISPHVIHAVIAAEDTGFCSHSGVDFVAIQTAWNEWRAGESLRGASTVSQQTAKNVFFWNGGGVPRKIGDAWMALFTDTVWGKPRVMEHYLNVAEWGDGIFGIEAAARIRFNKRAADLSEREAALLAAVLPNPNRWRVDPPGPYVRSRANTILARMNVVRRDGLASCVFAD